MAKSNNQFQVCSWLIYLCKVERPALFCSVVCGGGICCQLVGWLVGNLEGGLSLKTAGPHYNLSSDYIIHPGLQLAAKFKELPSSASPALRLQVLDVSLGLFPSLGNIFFSGFQETELYWPPSTPEHAPTLSLLGSFLVIQSTSRRWGVPTPSILTPGLTLPHDKTLAKGQWFWTKILICENTTVLPPSFMKTISYLWTPNLHVLTCLWYHPSRGGMLGSWV